MPLPAHYISSVFVSFSTFVERLRISEAEKADARDLLQGLLATKVDVECWEVKDVESFVSTHSGYSPVAIAVVSQFIDKFPPFQVCVYLNQFLLALADEGCSNSTIRNYRSDINQFWLFAKSTDLTKLLNKTTMAHFVANEQAKGLKDSSIRRKIAAISQFGLWAHRTDLITADVSWLSNAQLLEELQKPTTITTPSSSSKQAAKVETDQPLSPPLHSKPVAPLINPIALPVPLVPPITEVSQPRTPYTPPMALPIQATSRPTARKIQEHRAQLKEQLDELSQKIRRQSQRMMAPWLTFAAIGLFFLGLGVFGYQQLILNAPRPLAYPSAPVVPNRVLSFQGRLTDSAQNPLTTATDMSFKLFDASTLGTELWDSGTCSITPDQDGIFNTALGSTCGAGIPSSVFSENSNVWLEVTVEAETLDPRQPIWTVPYALNSETLQGYPISASGAATVNTVLTMDSSGDVVLGEVGPEIRSVSGQFTITGQSLLLRTQNNGNIILDADGTGGTFINDYLAAPGATLSATYAGGVPLTINHVVGATGNLTTWNVNGSPVAAMTAQGLSIGLPLQTGDSAATTGNIRVQSGAKFLFETSGTGNSLYRDTGTGDSVLTGDTAVRFGSSGSTSQVVLNTSTGGLTINSLNTPGGIIYAQSGGLLAATAVGTTNDCLLSAGAGTPTWGSCAGAVGSSIPWQVTNGTANLKNTTLDLLVGGNTTASAKFAVLNINSGVPTASIAGTTTGAATYITGEGTIATTRNRSLAINPSGGNVGIGIATPLAKLHVDSGTWETLFSDGTIDLKHSNGNTYGVIGNMGGAYGLQSYVSYPIVFRTNATERMRIDWTNGYVGIATTTPTAHLDVAGSASLSGTLSFRGTTDPTIDLLNGENLLFRTSVGGTAGVANRMTILNNGLVGINTTSPAAQFHVVGSTTASGSAIIGGTDYTIGGIAGLRKFFVGESAANMAGVTGLSGTPDLPVLGTYGSVGVVGSSNGSTGGRTQIGVFGHAYFDSAFSGNSSNNARGGNFLARLTSAVTDFNGSLYGTYSVGDSRGGTQTGGSVYGSYSEGVGETNNRVIGGYFTASGGSTNYGVFSNAGINYFVGPVTVGSVSPTGLLEVSGAPWLSGNSLAILNQTGTGNILVASASGTNRFVITNAGNVGIGTTTPGNALSVVGGASSNSTLGVFENSDSGTGVGAAIELRNSTTVSDALRIITLGTGYTTAGGYIQDSAVIAAESNLSGGLSLITRNASAPIRFYTGGHTNERMRITEAGNVGIGTTTAGSLLTVGTSGGLTINSSGAIAAATGITSSGTITFSGLSTAGGVVYTNGSGVLASVAGTTNDCLLSGGTGAPTWGSCASAVASSILWQEVLGTAQLKNTTLDLLVGGTTTASAKAAFLNINSGTPTASLSAGTAGGTFLTANGYLSTTARQDLILGNSSAYNTTGTIYLNPNGTGNVGIGTTSITSGYKLDVSGHIRASDTVFADGGTYTSFNAAGTFIGSTAIGAGGAVGYTGSSTTALWAGSGMPLVLGTNGTEYVRITSTGDVGIGTTTPLAKLQVTGSASAGGNSLAIFNQTGTGDIFTASDSGTTRFVITEAGNVGIGTTDPATRLDLVTTSSSQSLLRLDKPSLAGRGWQQFSIAGTTEWYMGMPDVDLYGDGDEFFISRSTSTADFLIDQSGNVGIGSISPTAELDIAGTASLSGTLSFRGTTDPKINILNGENFGIRTGSHGDGGLFERFTVSNNGNVGIGSTASAYPLTVVKNSSGTVAEFRAPSDVASYISITTTDTGSGESNGLTLGYNTQAMIHNRENTDLILSTNDTTRVTVDSTGTVGIGSDASPIAGLTIGADTTASLANAVADAYILGDLEVDGAFSLGDNGDTGEINTSSWDISTAGVASGFTGITSSGTITFSGLNTAGGIVYTNGSGVLATSAAGTLDDCLLSGGTGAPTWGSCAGAVSESILWQYALGTAQLKNTTLDLLVGGTTTASAKFAVLNINSGTPTASIAGTTAGAGLYMTGEGTIATTNSRSLLLNPVNGRVGIGTTSPAYTLDVTGTARASSFIGDNNGSASNVVYAVGNDIDTGIFGITTNTLNFATDGTERLRITATGEVGIGTTSVAAKFQVAGGTSRFTNTNNTNIIELGDTASSFDWAFYQSTNDFRIYDNNASTDAFTIKTSTGNVGIGTTNPAALLSVGSSSDFRVDSAGAITRVNGVAHTINSVTGDLTLTSNSANVSIADNLLVSGTITGNTDETINGIDINAGAVSDVTSLTASGTITFSGLNVAGGVVYTNGSGVLGSVAGDVNECLISNGSSAPAWGDCNAGATNYWNLASGTLQPVNSTLDLLVGGTTTASAKFAFYNVNSGTPTASIAGSVAGASTSITGDGTIATTMNRSLILNPSGGHVGIGTTAADATLHIKYPNSPTGPGVIIRGGDGVAENVALRLQDGGTGASNSNILEFGHGNTYVSGARIRSLNPASLASTGAHLILETASDNASNWNSNQLVLNRDGTIGIGTLSPTAALDIVGSASLSGTLSFRGTTNPKINILNGEDFGIRTSAGGDADLTERLTITTEGLVGIGTTSPSKGTLQVGSQAVNSSVGTAGIISSGDGQASRIAAVDGSRAVYMQLRNDLVGELSAYNYSASAINLSLQPDGGNVGITTTAPASLFSVGSTSQFQVNSSGIIAAIDNVAHTIDDISGDLTLTSNSTSVDIADNLAVTGLITAATDETINGIDISSGAVSDVTSLTASGTITFSGLNVAGGVVYTNGSGVLASVAGSTGNCLISNGSSAPSWGSCSSGAGLSKWNITSGAMSPINSTTDLLIGGTSTASAKFAFINVNSGTPTASIAGSVAGAATSITGDGTIATTMNRSLLLNPTGGNVGIGTTAATSKLDIFSAAVNSDVQRWMATDGSRLGRFTETSGGAGWFEVDNASGVAQWLLRGDGGNSYVASGNFGIGTTTPTALLDVAGTASLSGTLSFRGTTDPTIDILNGENFSIRTGSHGDGGLFERLTILNNGNIGIGTTVPGAYKLAISGGDVRLVSADTKIVGTSTTNFIQVETAAGSQNFATKGNLTFNLDSDNNQSTTYFAINKDVDDASSGEIFRVQENGIVGIGTSSPQYQLDVVGGYVQSRVTNGNATGFLIDNTASPLWGLQAATTGRFEIYDFSNTASRLSVLANGNVGIGTTTQVGKFEVNGTQGAGSNALAIFNQTGTGDIFTASDSGTTRFVITEAGNVGIGTTIPSAMLSVGSTSQFQVNSSGAIAAATGITSSGTITFSGLNTAGGVVYTNGSGVLASVAGSSGQCLTSNGASAPSWGACGSGGTSYWTLTNGAIHPTNSTTDVFIGGTATASAKFAFLNVNSGTPTASVSAGTSGAAFLTANGTLSTTSRQSLTIGNSTTYDTTGKVLISPAGGHVGIGTTDTRAELDLEGSASMSGVLTFRGTTDPKINILNGENFGIRTSRGGNTGLSERFTVLSNGNVGIGTATPDEQLHIDGGTTRFTFTDGQNLFELGDTASTFDWAWSLSSNDLRFEDNNGSTVPLTIQTITGNIGIGTTNPGALLSVGSTNQFQVNSSGIIAKVDNVAHTIDDVSGNLTLTSNSSSVSVPDNVLIGGTSETLSNAGYALGGDDLFVAGMAGIEGNVYTDGSFIAGASTTYSNGSISQSSGETLTMGTTAADLTLQTTTSGNIVLNSSGSIELQDNTNVTGNLDASGTLTAGTGNAFNVNASGAITAATGITSSGTITFSGLNTAGGILTTNGSGVLASVAGTSGQCLISNGTSAPSWGSCSEAAGLSKWNITSGALTPINSTVDLLLGGTATASSRIALTGVNTGDTALTLNNSTDSVTLNSNGDLVSESTLYLLSNGGNITLEPDLGAGTVTILGNTNLSSGKSYQINSTSVLNSTTLGSGVVNSSLTSVGTLTSLNVSGAVTFSNLNTAGGIVYTNGSGVLGTVAGSSGQCLTSNGTSTPSWGSCGTPGLAGLWNITSGAMHPANSTTDVLIGGTSTASAKVAITNINSGIPQLTVAGNVGIGTTGPGYKLDVVGTSIAGIRSKTTSGPAGIAIDAPAASQASLSFQKDGSQKWYVYSENSTHELKFSDGSDRLALMVGGNIGVGTTAPIAKFQVTGAPTAGTNALAIFNNTGSSDIIAASASGTTRFRIDTTGLVAASSFADIQNTAFYLDPAGTTSLNVAGAIISADTITGTVINGTTGINTGASAGTQRINNSGDFVNVRTITSSGTAPTTSDLGLYSSGSTNWMRFTTNNGEFKWFSNYTNGTSGAPSAGQEIMTLETSGVLDVNAGVQLGASNAFIVNSSGEISNIDGVGHTLTDSSGSLAINSAGSATIITDNLQLDGSTITASSLGTFTTAATLSMTSTTTLNLAADSNINGALYFDSTDDVNVGGDATPDNKFTVGSTSQFQVTSGGDIVSIGGAAHYITNDAGTLFIQPSGSLIELNSNVQIFGSLTVTGLNTAGGVLVSNGSGNISSVAGSATQCLISNGTSAPSWGSCGGGGGSSNWNVTAGALHPLNSTLDLLIGGTSTASADFAFTNMNTGTPTLTTTGNIAAGQVNGTSGIYSGAGSGTQRIDASGNFTNIRSINKGSTIPTTNDFGFYSEGTNNWVRFVSNNGKYSWYSNYATGISNSPASGSEVMSLDTDGSLDVNGDLTIGDGNEFVVSTAGIITKIDNVAHNVGDTSGNLELNSNGTKTIITDDLQVSGNDILDSTGTSRITLGSTNTITGTASFTGSVGIGSTSPAGKLNIDSTTAGNTTETLQRWGYASSSWYLNLNQQHVSGSHIQWNWTDNSGNDLMKFDRGNITIAGGSGATQNVTIGAQSGTTTVYGTIVANQVSNISATVRTLCYDAATNTVLKSGSNGATCTVSSARYKQNIATTEYGLDTVLQLKPVHFNYKPEYDDGSGQRVLGFIAEEMESIVPEGVFYNDAGLVNGVHYDRIVPIAIKAIQELNSKVDTQIASASANQNWTLSKLGTLNLIDQGNNTYAVATPTSSPVTQLSAFASSVIGNLRVGMINAQKVVTTSLVALQRVETPELSTDLISPVGDNDLTIGLQGTDGTDQATALNITNQDDEVVASIDGDGNATFAGQLLAQDISTATLSAQTVDATSARISQLEANMAQLEQIRANTAEIVTATVSGTLYADNIFAFQDKVANALQEPSLLAQLLGNVPQASSSTSLDTLTQIVDVSPEFASGSASLNKTLADLELGEEDVVLGSAAIFINEYFELNGSGYIADSLGIGNSLLVGNGTLIKDGVYEYVSSTDPSATLLQIQPSGFGSINLLAGLMTLDDSGLVTINGDLEVAGSVKADTLLTNLITTNDFTNPFQVQVAGASTESAEVRESRFEIINELGTPVATISAQGKAEFAGGIGVGAEDISGATGEPTTTKTSGKATVTAGTADITIKSSILTAKSLIYVTPVGSTGNQVLYVKSQVADNPATSENEGTFVVGFDAQTAQSVQFNWWIVN